MVDHNFVVYSRNNNPATITTRKKRFDLVMPNLLCIHFRSGNQCLVMTSQSYLKDLIKSCFIDASRTTAHKCSRLLALCIE